MEFIGTETGGRWFDRSLFKGTMFTFGVGEDISFELEAIAAGIKVICFDPTPKSILFMQNYPDIEFYPWGLLDKKGLKRFYLPSDPDYVSCSIDNLQWTYEYFEAPVYSLKQIIDCIEKTPDILKIDIEGAEYRVINWMFENNLFPCIFMVEFHENKNPKPFIRRISKIYREVHNEGNDYLFIK